MPRHSNVKPDFQAPGPRVLIEENINLEEDSDDDDYDNKDENDEESMPRVRYYESHKILGKLYRAIDEHRIFEQIQRDSRLPKAALMTDKNILNSVLKYVQKSTALIQFSHYIEFANDVKEA